ncbi:hypothetical protein GOBAR_AA33788 [Gossypium barbadense]|uniref:Uncharacterized protein n=1 Tax=Gossypium barbadense TaxID=3634 RepID=A0A2P5W760_GOSBA|nr:hypothetical protein GOBAR_AA33788 [Gossypium barbadense]
MQIEGNNANANDAIMLDKDGYVSETNATNIALPLERSVETPKIISVAQFRPEKEYMAVISYQFTVCISVVEYMAAGAIPIGFLAQNVEEYADAVLKIVKMPESERLKIATASARRRELADFSEQDFYDDLKASQSTIICGSS